MSTPFCAKLDGMAVRDEGKRLSFIPPSHIKPLLIDYFAYGIAELQKLEDWASPEYFKLMKTYMSGESSNDKVKKHTQDVRGLARTTGLHITDVLSYNDIHDIITKLSKQFVPVSGVQYEGRYVYVLACWCGIEKPHAEYNQKYPVPTNKQTVAAVKVFIKEIGALL